MSRADSLPRIVATELRDYLRCGVLSEGFARMTTRTRQWVLSSPFELRAPIAWDHDLHFHYRDFSAEQTAAARAQHPNVCCYLIYEFPRRH